MPFSSSRSSFSSSRSSFSSSRSSSSWGSAKSTYGGKPSVNDYKPTYTPPKVQSYAPAPKTTIIYRNAPAAKSYDSTPSLGSSMAHGAASGFGAGVGFGVANNLFNNHSGHASSTYGAPAGAPAQAPVQQTPVDQSGTYTEQPATPYIPPSQYNSSHDYGWEALSLILALAVAATVAVFFWKRRK